MNRKILLIAFCIFCLALSESRAQKFAISTNLLDYACLGTLNMEVSYTLARKYSISLSAQYNPFEFRKSDPARQFQLKQQAYSLGLRLWPWHSSTGWWCAGKIRYQEYSTGGIFSPETSEGDRFGLGAYAGYTYMLSSHWNLEFGLGFWTGMDLYRKYSCPVCGVLLAEGQKFFILPDQLMVAIAYVF